MEEEEVTEASAAAAEEGLGMVLVVAEWVIMMEHITPVKVGVLDMLNSPPLNYLLMIS